MLNELRTSLRLRLALIFVAGSLGTLLVVSGFLYWTFQREINLRNRLLLNARVEEIATILNRHPGDLAALQEEVQGEGSPAFEPQTSFRIISGSHLLLETPGMAERLPATWFVGQAKTRRHHRRYLMTLRTEGAFIIQGALDIKDDERMIFSYRRRLIYTLITGSILCAAFGFWAAHRGLRPLRAITESTRGITAYRLRNRLEPGRVPQELRDLVRALNDMLDRLDHAFSRLSQFSADLAHELRTPITNLMGEAEVTLTRDRPVEEYQQVLESSLEEFRRLSRLISRMLFLARAEDPQTAIARIPIDAKKLVDEVLAFYEAVAEEQGVTLEQEVSAPLFGDVDMLRQALANLLSNALDATPRGGHILLSLRSEDTRTVVAIQDSGRGIPEAEIPNLLDRFYRTQNTHHRKAAGTGLGLAIVRSIARLHGGDVTITSRLGSGTTVRLILP